MAGGDHDTGVGLIETGSKRERRHRHRLVINAHLNAIGSQHTGSLTGKGPALQACIIADGHSLSAALALYPVSHPLGSLAHHPNVHAVGACSQSAPETCCAELQRSSKALLDGLVISLDVTKLFPQITVNEIRLKPALVFVLIHKIHPSRKNHDSLKITAPLILQ